MEPQFTVTKHLFTNSARPSRKAILVNPYAEAALNVLMPSFTGLLSVGLAPFSSVSLLNIFKMRSGMKVTRIAADSIIAIVKNVPLISGRITVSKNESYPISPLVSAIESHPAIAMTGASKPRPAPIFASGFINTRPKQFSLIFEGILKGHRESPFLDVMQRDVSASPLLSIIRGQA
jgi:hypothetical protein